MKSISLLALLLIASSCSSIREMMDMSPTPDAVIAAEDAAKVASLVKKLHEPAHTSFFGAQAEGEREEAPNTLAEMKAYVAIPDLAQAVVKDTNHQLRANAAHALWILSDHAQAAEPALREALKDNWTNVNLYAALALWDMHVASTELIPVLKELCASRDLYAAVRAANLAITIEKDPTDYVQCLMRGMFDREESFHVIATIRDGTRYKAYLPVLLEGTRSAYPKVRTTSVNLLGAYVYASPEVTYLLRKMAVSEGNETVRLNAVQSLVSGGEGLEAGVPAGTAEGTGAETIALLVTLLQGDDWQVRKMSAQALRDARAGGPEVIAALTATLKDPVNDVRIAAAHALRDLGLPAAAPAKPALYAIWSDYVKLANANAKISSDDTDFFHAVWRTLTELGETPAGAPAP
jgi:HEAT repeat protein